MGVSIRDNRIAYDTLLKRVDSLRGAVNVGVSSVPHGRGKTAADIGLIHEYGLGVPQRSFLRSWVDRQGGKIKTTLKGYILGAILRGNVRWKEPFGEYCVRGVQDNIRSNIPPPLAEETVKRKGRDLALVDTEILINAITYEDA